ncbi:hypothetical protein [Halopenitus persicus]|uniref:hypothetical protein n=1 Tax=Halopenitus persicus TaxID=1048396 RepID=UPI0012FE4E68|nr:hypothetical protein [Halopenitus persicus]
MSVDTNATGALKAAMGQLEDPVESIALVATAFRRSTSFPGADASPGHQRGIEAPGRPRGIEASMSSVVKLLDSVRRRATTTNGT